MRANERASYDGYEVCLFPLDYLYCTQKSGPDSYSHCCGHPADWVGSHYVYPYYAPFSCTRYYYGPDSDGAPVCYVSDDKVWTPKGLSYVSVEFAHDDNRPTKTHFNQGELIGHTGTTPPALVTGDHLHMDQSNIANAPLVSYGITCAYGNECYALQNSTTAEDIFYLSGSETIAQTQGMNFEKWTGSPIHHGGGFKWWMSKRVIERRKNGL